MAIAENMLEIVKVWSDQSSKVMVTAKCWAMVRTKGEGEASRPRRETAEATQQQKQSIHNNVRIRLVGAGLGPSS